MKTPTELINRKKDTSVESTSRNDYGVDDSYEGSRTDLDGSRNATMPNRRQRLHTSEHSGGPVDGDVHRRLSLHNRKSRNDRG